jgi:hypothetical protein
MEFVVLALFALGAAVAIGLPWTRPIEAAAGIEELRARRAGLLTELAELDTDLAEGRIAPADRIAGRRALAPELRRVTEQLHALGAGREPS